MRTLHYQRSHVPNAAKLEEIIVDLYPVLAGQTTINISGQDIWVDVPDETTVDQINLALSQYDLESFAIQTNAKVVMRVREIAGLTYSQVATAVENKFPSLTQEQRDYLIDRDQLLLAIVKHLFGLSV